MLFPAVERVPRAGSRRPASPTSRVRELAPDWYRDRRAPYALAVSGVKPAAGPSPRRAPAAAPRTAGAAGRASALRVRGRFVAGSAAGAAFVPIAAALDAARPAAGARG